jgi:hypothetical protein
MFNGIAATAAYFRASADYFWLWAENGTIVEWKDGQTICYREDLLPILEKLSPEGLPPLGAILLILTSCRDDWKAVSAGKTRLLYAIVQMIEEQNGGHPNLFLRECVKPVGLLLDLVSALPQEYRSGAKRTHLLYTLFRNEPDKLVPELSKECIEIFNRGVADRLIFKPGVLSPIKTFELEMEALCRVQKRYEEASILEMELRTGLKEIPVPAELDLKRDGTVNFLSWLEEDPRLTGLIRLTRKMIAALNIPLHSHGSSDRFLGGVSDIANRGSFDRLLISELANEDDALMARLANNEALFLRREDLPSDPDRERILLIDTTVKMWGRPRIFALAAALACTCNLRPGMKSSAYVLGANEYLDVDLRSKEGILKALERLDIALDCRLSLQNFLDGTALLKHMEIFLITEDAWLHDWQFQAAMADRKFAMTACITVERSGQMRFYEMSKGRRKLTSEARFELESLVRPEENWASPKARGGPAILQRSPFPLYHPASKMKFRPEHCYMPLKGKIFCITLDNRLLYWHSNLFGSRELVQAVRSGNYYWSFDGKSEIYLLGRSGQGIWLYRVALDTRRVLYEEIDFQGGFVGKVVVDRHHFYLYTPDKWFLLDARKGATSYGEGAMPSANLQISRQIETNWQELKTFVNNGYTVWRSVKSVLINQKAELCLDTRYIKCLRNELTIASAVGHGREWAIVLERADSSNWIEGASFTFHRFVSKDGSEVVVDSRGFLHLRSSDKKLPEVTIVLVIDKPTAAWASDGKTCGSTYFTGQSSNGDIESFYYQYIRPIIEVIKKNAAIHSI